MGSWASGRAVDMTTCLSHGAGPLSTKPPIGRLLHCSMMALNVSGEGAFEGVAHGVDQRYGLDHAGVRSETEQPVEHRRDVGDDEGEPDPPIGGGGDALVGVPLSRANFGRGRN